MNNYWLNRAEQKAMTMEEKIEKMLAPHHVIWLGDETVGTDAKPIETPNQITVTWGQPQLAEWDFNITIDVGSQMDAAGICSMIAEPSPHSDYCFDINTCSADIAAQIEEALENEFARAVESEGWNLDL